ncbi:MAG: DUF2063 domain-containing protein [Porticoccaceae bacterium]|nr:DUF2063 domain-containing protein [Porticoccaceae bacterium]
MNTPLADSQEKMAHALLNHSNEGLGEIFAHDEAELQARIAVYRNNVFFSLSNAISDLYPVINQLVGEEFFLALAKRYIRENPPASAAMVFFGAEFPEFVSQDKACLSLPYLADVARFELAKQHCYHAQDAKPLSLQIMHELGAEKLMASVLKLHPSLRLVDSKTASRSIWQAHQIEKPNFSEIDVATAEQSILVRPEFDLLICRADAALLLLITEIEKGAILAEAIDMTLEKYPGFDLASAMAMGFSNGFFTDIHSPQE